jgi:hypothetical protein
VSVICNSIKSIVFIAFFMAVCTVNGIAQDKDKRQKICITEQEFAVYEAIGVENFTSETTAHPLPKNPEEQFPGLSVDALTDYKNNNGKSYLLRCVLRRDLKKKKLKTYYYSNMDFSRIGFNRGETEALVYMGWSGLGNTCESDFYHLRKEDNKWKVVKKVMMVIC